jgi:hypothetical protein
MATIITQPKPQPQLETSPIRVNLCKHHSDLSFSLRIENRHVDMTTYPYTHCNGMVTNLAIFQLKRQDIIDLAHALLEAALPATDPEPPTETKEEV